ncbi:MAG: zinc ribbon domain-containing protein [Clostridia bacterium]|nr:zinc ribbon domain-containing protein [Clostridia bacterium]MBQ3042034.1 zinc ribbon domain-containing protein [Clostridia bacterium]
MLSSNSFNLCPHCGNSNTLNARFCARCGTQLKVPEEVVVCRACGTRNSPMANFCRNCGSQLKVGEQTKICPRCRKEVPASDNTCSCGYSFATITTVAPTADTTASAREERRGKKQKGVRAGRAVVSKKGGRAFAIVAMVFLLVFAYFFVAPQNLRPSFLAFDKGLYYEGKNIAYGYTFILLLLYQIIDAVSNPGGNMFNAIMGALGDNVAKIMVSIMVVIFVLCVVVHFIVCFTRAFTSKRSKKANKFYLVLAVLTTVATALILLPQLLGADFLGGVLKIFAMPDGFGFGWVLCAIPAYYWFFFIYSAIAKGKSLTEQVA